MRVGVAVREVAQGMGKRYFASGLLSSLRSTWDRRFADTPVPVGAFFWYKGQDGLYSTLGSAVCGSSCLQVHGGSALMKGLLRNVDMSRNVETEHGSPDDSVRVD